MKKYGKIMLIVSVLALTAMTSCKGRTMNNMEPTGDTVVVDVQQNDAPNVVQDAEVPDTIAVK
jgi:hypothetical protein